MGLSTSASLRIDMGLWTSASLMIDMGLSTGANLRIDMGLWTGASPAVVPAQSTNASPAMELTCLIDTSRVSSFPHSHERYITHLFFAVEVSLVFVSLWVSIFLPTPCSSLHLFREKILRLKEHPRSLHTNLRFNKLNFGHFR